METIKPYQQFKNEEYTCSFCDQTLEKAEIRNWKCPDCGNRVLIQLPKELNSNICLVRMLPSELKKSDIVYLFETGLHIVLDVHNDFMGERIYAALKDFGMVQFKDSWINVMWSNNEIID